MTNLKVAIKKMIDKRNVKVKVKDGKILITYTLPHTYKKFGKLSL